MFMKKQYVTALVALIIDLPWPILLRGFQLNSPIKSISCQSK
jgi:hypothetical protein